MTLNLQTCQLCMLDYKLPGCKSADTTFVLKQPLAHRGISQYKTIATGSLTGLKLTGIAHSVTRSEERTSHHSTMFWQKDAACEQGADFTITPRVIVDECTLNRSVYLLGMCTSN